MVPLVFLLLASSFPLPAVDGKPLAVTEHQKSFRLPMRFEKVRAFYDEQLKGRPEVVMRLSGNPGSRVLAITNRNTSDSWRKATISEKEMETVVEVTPVPRMGEEAVSGQGRPLVEFIISRSPEVDRAVQGIDHLEQLR